VTQRHHRQHHPQGRPQRLLLPPGRREAHPERSAPDRLPACLALDEDHRTDRTTGRLSNRLAIIASLGPMRPGTPKSGSEHRREQHTDAPGRRRLPGFTLLQLALTFRDVYLEVKSVDPRKANEIPSRTQRQLARSAVGNGGPKSGPLVLGAGLAVQQERRDPATR